MIYVLIGPQSLTLHTDRKNYKTLSLLPLSRKATGITLTGDFKYPLNDEDLTLGLTKGISNELGPDGGNVFLSGGLLMVIVSPLFEPGPSFNKSASAAMGWKKSFDTKGHRTRKAETAKKHSSKSLAKPT
jgi:hypothetical protein